MIRNKWTKSSLCPNGSACVEVLFKKPSKCADCVDCVEVGECDCNGGTFHVRDGKNPEGPVLSFTLEEWNAFLGGVSNGEFNPKR